MRRIIDVPSDYRSPEGALFVALMDDQSRRLHEDTRDLEPEALGWQSAPGTNTIGMLLAHIAIVEVIWIRIGLEGIQNAPVNDVLGLNRADDGIPLAEGGTPPSALKGKDLLFFDDLLARARAHTVKIVRPLESTAIVADRVLERADGSTFTTNARWILYHLLEHLARHYGQVNLLRHQHRLARGGG